MDPDIDGLDVTSAQNLPLICGLTCVGAAVLLLGLFIRYYDFKIKSLHFGLSLFVASAAFVGLLVIFPTDVALSVGAARGELKSEDFENVKPLLKAFYQLFYW